MINPPAPPAIPKPKISDIGLPVQMFSPEPQEPESNFASPLLPTPGPSDHSSLTSLSIHRSGKQTPLTSALDRVIARGSPASGYNLKVSHL